MNSKTANIIATYFGLGLSKYAPGTMGSLGTLPLAYALIYFCGFYGLVITAVVLFFIGVKATDVVIKECKDDDPSKVVIDETVGQLLSFSCVALIAPEYLLGIKSILYYIAGFAFFRFFDILKMGPVKYADTKIKNAYGVMLDDVFAGIFAAILLWGVLCLQLNA
ncbi:MAG: phosphatidylglycerophosphatase A [Acetobacter sp.]|nr:phosphatidylglycerophosphatase A [Acetobacter sp.]